MFALVYHKESIATQDRDKRSFLTVHTIVVPGLCLTYRIIIIQDLLAKLMLIDHFYNKSLEHALQKYNFSIMR